MRLRQECRLSHQEIARAMRVSKTAVTKYLALAESAGLSWKQARECEDAALHERLNPAAPAPRRGEVFVQPDRASIRQERKGATLQLLWEQNQAQGRCYRSSCFCELYREFAARLGICMRPVRRAGEKLVADYSGDTLGVFDG